MCSRMRSITWLASCATVPAAHDAKVSMAARSKITMINDSPLNTLLKLWVSATPIDKGRGSSGNLMSWSFRILWKVFLSKHNLMLVGKKPQSTEKYLAKDFFLLKIVVDVFLCL